MSTNDVPGAVPANADQLAMGCWAEHADGSMIFVKSTEGGQVIYEVYDLNQVPVLFFQDAMLEAGFKQKYSWDPKNPNKSFGKWTWHDKTPFPWDKVMKAAKPGLTYASASDQLSAAQKVADALGVPAPAIPAPTAAQQAAQALGASATPLDADKIKHMVSNLGPRGKFMYDRISSAIANLPPDEAMVEVSAVVKEIAAAQG